MWYTYPSSGYSDADLDEEDGGRSGGSGSESDLSQSAPQQPLPPRMSIESAGIRLDYGTGEEEDDGEEEQGGGEEGGGGGGRRLTTLEPAGRPA